MRGIETSSTSASGLCLSASCTASTPSSASATTRIPSCWSSSIRTPERTIPWSSATRMWIIRPALCSCSFVPLPGPRRDLEVAIHPGRARSGRCRLQAEAALLGVVVEPGAVVGHGERHRPVVHGGIATSTLARPCVPRDVVERLLGDAVQHELSSRCPGRPANPSSSSRISTPCWALKRLSCSSIAGQEPVVVERGRAEAAGRAGGAPPSPDWQAPFVSASSSRRRGGAHLRERLEPEAGRGQRLVHLVVEVARDPLSLLLLRAELEPAGAAALRLDPLEQLREGMGEPLDLLDRLLGGLERRGIARDRSPRSRRSAAPAG